MLLSLLHFPVITFLIFLIFLEMRLGGSETDLRDMQVVAMELLD